MVVYPAAWHSRPALAEAPRSTHPVPRPGLALVPFHGPHPRAHGDLLAGVAAGLAPVHRVQLDPATRALLEARASLV